jgi:hypothetical protein
MTVGRNEPCPCGSGRKFKRCCLGVVPRSTPSEIAARPEIRVDQAGRAQDPNDKLAGFGRTPPSVLVNIDQIDIPDFVEDSALVAAYAPFQSGKSPVVATRVPLSTLSPDFLLDGRMIREVPSDQREIDHVASAIRRGDRPAAFAYWSEERNIYVCSDDAVIYDAYQQCRIQMVPTLILTPEPGRLFVSGLAFFDRFKAWGQFGQMVYDKPMIPIAEKVPPTIPDGGLTGEKIALAFEACERKIRAFAVTGRTHYHEWLLLTLWRARRLWDSITAVRPRAPDHALILLRSLYELVLQAYIDWLAPQMVGPVMLFSARAAASGWDFKTIAEAAEKEKIQDGWRDNDAGEWRKSLIKLQQLLVTVSEHSRLSPLRNLHESLYKILSRMSHQDPSTSQDFLVATDHGVRIHEEPLAKDAEAVIDGFSPSLIGLLAWMIDSDIGSATETNTPTGKSVNSS